VLGYDWINKLTERIVILLIWAMPFHDVPRVPSLCLSGNMWLGWPNAAWFGECQGTPKRAHSTCTLLLAQLSPPFLGVGTRTFFSFNWKQQIVMTQLTIQCGWQDRATVKILSKNTTFTSAGNPQINFENRNYPGHSAPSPSSQHYMCRGKRLFKIGM
jgi:hypothetical protein